MFAHTHTLILVRTITRSNPRTRALKILHRTARSLTASLVRKRSREKKTERDRMLPVYSPWSALSSFVSQRWTKNGSVQPSLALQRWNSSWQPVSHLYVCVSAWKSQTIISDFIMKACVSADCEEKWGTPPLVLTQTHTHTLDVGSEIMISKA